MKNIEAKVKMLLETNPKTRDDDDLLMLEYCALVGVNVQRPFYAVMQDASTPNRESVTRARRKLQEKHEELRGSKYVQRARKKREEKFREYSRT